MIYLHRSNLFWDGKSIHYSAQVQNEKSRVKSLYASFTFGNLVNQ